jgi:hypothetical protein
VVSFGSHLKERDYVLPITGVFGFFKDNAIVYFFYNCFAREGSLGGETQFFGRMILVEIAGGYHL